MRSARMALIRFTYGVAVFVAALLVFGRLMAHEDTAKTQDMARASLPVVVMQAGDLSFNELHGFTTERALGKYRGVITPLGSDRKVTAHIETFGEEVTSLGYEVRTLSGSRLIEDTRIQDYEAGSDGTIPVSFTLKDLIDPDQEYVLDIRLSTKEHPDVRYYTRILCQSSDSTLYQDALSFVNTFHEKTIEGTDTAYLADYIEPDESKQSASYALVTIHSSIRQVAFGSLAPTEVTKPVYSMTEDEGATFLLSGSYTISCPDPSAPEDASKANIYECREYYRIYRGFDRFHLIDFQRTMNEIYDPQERDFSSDAIDLGITTTDHDVSTSPDDGTLAFVDGGRLYSVNVDHDTIAYVYGFADRDSTDARELWPDHDIRILQVAEDGSIDFLAYGYMNRGPQEGSVGVAEYHYDARYRTIEEMAFLPYGGSYDLLQSAVAGGAYLSDSGKLYLALEDVLYEMDIRQQSVNTVDTGRATGMVVSDGGRMVAWKNAESTGSTDGSKAAAAGGNDGSITFLDLSDLSRQTITPGEGEILTPIGFLGEDLIYGIARESDATTDATGMTYVPMYTICIVDHDLNSLENYEEDGYYITEAVIEENQITLHRVQKTDAGYVQATDDQIVSSAEEKSTSSLLTAVSDDTLGQTVTLAAAGFSPDNFRYLRPREIVYDNSGAYQAPRETDLTSSTEAAATAEENESGSQADMTDMTEADTSGSAGKKYYVYGTYGFERYYYEAADAVRRAAEEAAIVVDDSDRYIWRTATRDRCELENVGTGKDYLTALNAGQTTAVNACLDAMLRYENADVDVDQALASGTDTAALIEESLPGSTAIELTGCTLEQVLYYPNADTPVMALTGDGVTTSRSAVLIIGYGPENVALWDPWSGRAETLMSRTEAAALFQKAGNHFLTYQKPEQ